MTDELNYNADNSESECETEPNDKINLANDMLQVLASEPLKDLIPTEEDLNEYYKSIGEV